MFEGCMHLSVYVSIYLRVNFFIFVPYLSLTSMSKATINFNMKCLLPLERALIWGGVGMSLCAFLGGGGCVCVGGWLHPRRVTTVTRCSLPPSGLGQVGRHGDWVVTDFVTSPLGRHGWVNLKNTPIRRHTCNACTYTCT